MSRDGSSPGSSTTSLAKPRMVVVHGATSVHRSLGIATSRESTTTGLRPISDNSHHQSSPRSGRALTTLPQLCETRRDRPTHRLRQTDARRTPNRSRRCRVRGDEQARRPTLMPRCCDRPTCPARPAAPYQSNADPGRMASSPPSSVRQSAARASRKSVGIKVDALGRLPTAGRRSDRGGPPCRSACEPCDRSCPSASRA